MCGICSKLTVKTPERRHRCHSTALIINFEKISHTVVSIVYIEQVMPAGNQQ